MQQSLFILIFTYIYIHMYICICLIVIQIGFRFFMSTFHWIFFALSKCIRSSKFVHLSRFLDTSVRTHLHTYTYVLHIYGTYIQTYKSPLVFIVTTFWLKLLILLYNSLTESTSWTRTADCVGIYRDGRLTVRLIITLCPVFISFRCLSAIFHKCTYVCTYLSWLLVKLYFLYCASLSFVSLCKISVRKIEKNREKIWKINVNK